MKFIKIYVGCKYEDKDDLKIKGGKFDPDEKKWYFIYELDEYNKNKSLGTYNYKPFRVKIVDSKNDLYDKVMERYNCI